MNPFKRMAELVEQERESMASTQSIIRSQDKNKAMQDRINKIFGKYKPNPDPEPAPKPEPKRKPKPEGSN